MALSYPKRLRTPTQRKGALSYEIRVRVPGEARGEKFKGTHTTRSLGTRDKAQALRNVPKTYDGLHAEFDAEADRLRGAMPAAPILSVAEVCRIQSENLLAGEEKYRREFVAGYQGDPVALARNHRARLRRQLAQYQALAANRDYANGEWLLTWLSKSGQGDVVNRDAALRALARNAVRVIREIIADDMAVSADDDPVIDDDTPTLSAHAEAYLDRRARELTEERAAMFRAVVFIDLVGADRPVSDYTKSDAMKFMDALACLPANRTKDRRLRALSIGDAAVEAKSKSLPVQSAQSIRKKVALIKAVFADAKDRYEDVDITFPTRTLPKRGAANDARDPFTDQELKTLLGSAPPGHLYWLTWLGLCTELG